MIKPTSFDFSVTEGIARIVFRRPEKYNALTFNVYRELTQLFEDLTSRNDVRVVIVTGSGKAFCSGGDVVEIIGPLLGKPEEQLLEFTRTTCRLVWNMRSLLKPVIASLNGVAAGAGAMIALASDFRIATESARIAFLFSRVGLSGADMGACYLLPKIVGVSKATELLMLGNFISAQEALQAGLYHRVVSAENLADETMSLAQELAAGSSHGIAVTKKQINEETFPRLKEVLEAEAKAQARCMLHPDYQEGYRAFMEKRQPKFQ